MLKLSDIPMVQAKARELLRLRKCAGKPVTEVSFLCGQRGTFESEGGEFNNDERRREYASPVPTDVAEAIAAAIQLRADAIEAELRSVGFDVLDLDEWAKSDDAAVPF